MTTRIYDNLTVYRHINNTKVICFISEHDAGAVNFQQTRESFSRYNKTQNKARSAVFQQHVSR